MEIESNGQKVLKSYRERAIWGGAALGMFIGTIAGGPNVASWPEPIKTYSMYIFGGGVIGALAGFLFYEIFLSSLAGAGPSAGFLSHDDHTGSHDSSSPSAESEGGFSDVADGGHD